MNNIKNASAIKGVDFLSWGFDLNYNISGGGIFNGVLYDFMQCVEVNSSIKSSESVPINARSYFVIGGDEYSDTQPHFDFDVSSEVMDIIRWYDSDGDDEDRIQLELIKKELDRLSDKIRVSLNGTQKKGVSDEV